MRSNERRSIVDTPRWEGWVKRWRGQLAKRLATTDCTDAEVFRRVDETLLAWVSEALQPVEIPQDVWPSAAAMQGAPASFRQRVRQQHWDARALGPLYEYLLEHPWRPEEGGTRRRSGRVFTPDALAQRVVAHAALRGGGQRVLDPACGAGIFLLHAWRAMDASSARTLDARCEGLDASVFGVDVDATAVRLTRRALWLAALDGLVEAPSRVALVRLRQVLQRNIRCADALMARAEGVESWATHFDWLAQGGVDVVLGNPPYVRHERLGGQQASWQAFESFAPGADLYVYFIERGLSLLAPGGRLSFVVADTWLRARFGAPLRRLLKRHRVVSITDLSGQDVFRGVTTYPCVLTVERQPAGASIHVVKPALASSKGRGVERCFEVMLRTLDDDAGWQLVEPRHQALMTHLKAVGRPLGEVHEGRLCRGLVTGLNRAFVVDEATRSRWRNEDPASASLLRPFAVGRDLKRFRPLAPQRHVILMPRGWTAARMGAEASLLEAQAWMRARYPSVMSHLMRFEEAAKRRRDQGTYWWELRACRYYDVFDADKLMFPELAQRGQAVWDTQRCVGDSTTYVLEGAPTWLRGVFNARVWTFMMVSTSARVRGGYHRWKRQYVRALPVAGMDDGRDKQGLRDEIAACVRAMEACHREVDDEGSKRATLQALDERLNEAVESLYEVPCKMRRWLDEQAWPG